jgi:hypothetical protein
MARPLQNNRYSSIMSKFDKSGLLTNLCNASLIEAGGYRRRAKCCAKVQHAMILSSKVAKFRKYLCIDAPLALSHQHVSDD